MYADRISDNIHKEKRVCGRHAKEAIQWNNSADEFNMSPSDYHFSTGLGTLLRERNPFIMVGWSPNVIENRAEYAYEEYLKCQGHMWRKTQRHWHWSLAHLALSSWESSERGEDVSCQEAEIQVCGCTVLCSKQSSGPKVSIHCSINHTSWISTPALRHKLRIRQTSTVDIN